MIRAAAKNHRYVAVVTSPMQYNVLVQELSENNGCTSYDTRKKLAARAFADTAAYDSMIAAYFSEQLGTEAPVVTRVYEHQVCSSTPRQIDRACADVALLSLRSTR